MTAPAATLESAERDGPLPPASRRRLLRVAWWAIGLGLGMEALLLGATALLGEAPGAAAFVAEAASFVSWSVLVCAGLSAGDAAARGRAGLAGAIGAAVAPVAFFAARAAHAGMAQALDVDPAAAAIPPALVAVTKAGEYAVLAGVVAALGRRAVASPAAHAGAGLAVGVVFGGFLVALLLARADPTPAAVVGRALNEVLFPVGCALVLYAFRNESRP